MALSVSWSTKTATGVEGSAVALGSISVSGITGSPTTLVVSGIPVGAVLNDGHGHSFTATQSTTSVSVLGWTLSGLTITPANDTNFPLTVTATEATTSSSSSEAVTVNPLVSTVSWAPAPESGVEGTAIALGTLSAVINGKTGDSNSLSSLVISSIPVGATLSDGAGHTFTATSKSTSTSVLGWTLTSLKVTPASDASFTLTVSATEKNSAGDTGATTSTTESVTVDPITVSLSNTKSTVSSAGVTTFVTPLTGFGSDTLTINANTSASFVLGTDSLSFAAGALASVSYSGGAFNFGINSPASGYSETVNWNPTTGKALLELTNTATGSTFASSLGYIDPGDTLQVTGASLGLFSANGTERNVTDVNADGSQTDISYNTTGTGIWTDNIYNYTASGVLTSIFWDNSDTSFSRDFYDGASDHIGSIIYNADGVLHVNNATIVAANDFTSAMTVLNVTGSGGISAAELAQFTTLLNMTGADAVLTATSNGVYNIAGDAVEGTFDLNASGTSGAVTLSGYGSDTLTAGTGNDTLNGGNGTTSYDIGASFGQGVINNDGSKAASGAVNFAGATEKQLWFQQSGNNLQIDLLGTTDTLTIDNWFGSNTGAQVAAINTSDGETLLNAQVAQLIQAMASYSAANPGFNPSTATAMPTNTTLQSSLSAAWKKDWNNNGVATTKYDDTKGKLEATETLNANDSGTITTADGQTLSFAAGDVASAVSVDTSGDVQVSLTPNGGAAETLLLTKSGIATTVNGSQLADTIPSSNVAVDNLGNIITTAPLSGIGSSEMVVGTNGTDTLTVDFDSITMPSSSVTSVSYTGGAFVFGLVSTASGYGESVSWNPETGKAILDITNTATDSTFASSLGYINPGDTLEVTGADLGLFNASGTELNATDVNVDGSQNDITYNTTGSGIWTDSIYNYDASGDLTSIRVDNSDGTDTLTAGSGNDVLNGGSGTTAYDIGSSFGQDTINNNGGNAASGMVNFAGATEQQLWFQQSGNNLQIDLLGTADTLTVDNWFGSNAGAQVAAISASDGDTLLNGQVLQLVQAMATYSTANPGFNPTTATAMPNDPTLQTTLAASWHS